MKFLKTKNGVTMSQLLIGVALIGVIFIPVASSIFKATKKIHTLNFEVVAETFAKSALDEILKKVPFDHVTEAKLTIGDSDDMDVKLNMADIYKSVEFKGNTSGSEIIIDDCTYKWEIEVTDLKGKDIFVSSWRVERKGYSDQEMKADPKTLEKKAVIKNFQAEEFSKRKRQILMKTIRFRVWWKYNLNTEYSPDYKFCLVTRKARLEDISGL